MTGKAIDNSATGALVLILPIAITIVLVLKAWPFLLLLMVLIISGKIWQSYQWKKWSQEVNPFFTELIQENQGCLTPLDLSLKANMTASAANRFLAKKAEEYGAQKKTYADKGVVYYFLTASALGSIFADSDDLSELEESPETETSPQLSTSSEKFPPSSTKEFAELVDEKQPISSPVEEIQTENPSTEMEIEESPVEEIVNETLPLGKDSSEELPTEEKQNPDNFSFLAEKSSPQQETKTKRLSLIQAELAKRLDINSSTIGRRKSDPDFSLWSQTKDPEGIAWKYLRRTKMFVSVDLDEE